MDDRSVRPAGLDELAPPDRIAGTGSETREDPELGRCEVGVLAAARCRVGGWVEAEVTDVGGEVAVAAFDEGVEAGNELGERERLGQIVVTAGRKPREAVG